MALPQAPWPTLQLLRSVDLQRARAEWLRSGAPGPGALGAAAAQQGATEAAGTTAAAAAL